VRSFFGTGIRLCACLVVFLGSYLDFLLSVRFRGRGSSLQARAEWLQKWSGRLLRTMELEVEWEGKLPSSGILASNHLGYMDVFVYASICPLIFVSKSEVKSWPVAGTLTRCAGTLYLVRRSRADLVRVGKEMTPVVNSGMVVTLFLEGTSSDGHEVLPFRSSLLASAEEHGWTATPSWIHYTMPEGSVEQDVCYWGDMTFVPHFLKLLGKRGVRAHVRFGDQVKEKLARKDLARALHAEVCKMKNEFERAETLTGKRIEDGVCDNRH
jgi:1-acyl-sn-glycerol-3-phosphate acyltransferase